MAEYGLKLDGFPYCAMVTMKMFFTGKKLKENDNNESQHQK